MHTFFLVLLQTRRMAEVTWDLWRTSGPTPLLWGGVHRSFL